MSKSKRILVGVPMHKGEIHSQVLHSTLMGSSDVHEVDVFPLGLSLLAKCFNMLWIKAYMKQYDYFVIHHSDLGVVGNLTGYGGTWMDLLVERMQQFHAAAICPVIDIKSEDGLTTTAVELESGNPYSLRRLTKRESQHCPVEKIGREDLADVMGFNIKDAGAFLINTGVLIMDLKNFDWTQWPGFNIEDKIAWTTKGIPSSYTIPEDWGLSRFLHYQTKWPYYATRELIVAHMGTRVFLSNEHSYGKEHDDPPGQPSIEEYEAS